MRELGIKSDIPIQGLTSAKAATVYHVFVTTSNMAGAGTDASVFIQFESDRIVIAMHHYFTEYGFHYRWHPNDDLPNSIAPCKFHRWLADGSSYQIVRRQE